MKYLLYCRKSTEAEDRQVMSLDSQRGELERAFGTGADIEIVEFLEEAKSAKEPGRTVFNLMIARIERGEAQGIIAWAPDRLARNSIDGGHIIHLLDRGVLRDLKFATYTFENNSQGKFMLSIMFGQSKYYSDALSENVKRGNRTKAARGWRPGSAPMGYLNDPASKTIVADPTYFPMVRRMFELALVDGNSSREIARIAREEWALRSPKRRRGGGTIHDSMVHRLLTNPFYAGLFMWEGQLIQGKHQPAVSLEVFHRVQSTIRRSATRRSKHHFFPLTGLVKCGECGHSVTAQHSTNRFGSKYVYYRCTRKGTRNSCRQPAIRGEALETQVLEWLDELSLGSAEEARLRKRLINSKNEAQTLATAVRGSLEQALKDAKTQCAELVDLRLRRLIDDQEFIERRSTLQSESLRLEQRLQEADSPQEAVKPFDAAISFGSYAADWFRHGDDVLKRRIVSAAGSNLALTDKKLSIQPAKWLMFMRVLASCPTGLGLRDDVQTPESASVGGSTMAERIRQLQEDPQAWNQLRQAAHLARAKTEARQLC